MTVSCPYCNHAFTPPASMGRVVCPRCAESVQLGMRGEMTETAPADASVGPPPMRADNPRIGVLIPLLFTGVVAVAGVLLYLMNWPRTPHPPQDSVAELPIQARATPPLKLAGLNHLPTNCNVLFAIQPGPMLAFCERIGQDPVQVLTRNRIPTSALGTLASAGITLNQIDHIAGGLRIPDGEEELRVCIVLMLRKPLPDEARFLERLHAKEERPGRYEARFDRLPLKMARISETQWAFGLSEKDLAGGDQAPKFLDFVEKKVPQDAAAWVAIDEAEWPKKPLVEALLRGSGWNPRRIAIAGRGRAAAIAYSFTDPPHLGLAVKCADSGSAKGLQSYFSSRAKGESARSGSQGEWCDLTIPSDPENAFSTIKSFLAEIEN